MSTIAVINEAVCHVDLSDLFCRGDRLFQCVPIVRVPLAKSNSHNPVVAICRGHPNLLAKFVTLVIFPIADALHFRFVQAVIFVLILLLLSMHTLAQDQQSFRAASDCGTLRRMSRITRPSQVLSFRNRFRIRLNCLACA